MITIVILFLRIKLICICLFNKLINYKQLKLHFYTYFSGKSTAEQNNVFTVIEGTGQRRPMIMNMAKGKFPMLKIMIIHQFAIKVIKVN